MANVWFAQAARELQEFAEMGDITVGFDVGVDDQPVYFRRLPPAYCKECHEADGHKMGCLTPEVQAGRMTPRQRQIKLLEAQERKDRRTSDHGARLHAAIDAAGRDGGRIEKIVLGQSAWQAVCTSLPNGAPLSPRHGLQPSQGSVKYAGYPVEVSAFAPPDSISVIRAPDPITLLNGLTS